MLANKTAIIYGGGGAIGGAVAREFARQGAKVFLAGRTLSKLVKVAAAGLTPRSSDLVRPPRVAECPLQLEARSIALNPGKESCFLSVECEVVRVHADERIVVPGTHHIDPNVWNPLIYNFRHYHGLTPEPGHDFRSETAKAATRVG